eukprot:12035246-Alexandrium_andersonii.AAC.1
MSSWVGMGLTRSVLTRIGLRAWCLRPRSTFPRSLLRCRSLGLLLGTLGGRRRAESVYLKTL